jgi:hypothetical protein
MLTFFMQDAGSKRILYTAADIQREEVDDQVLSFLSCWKKVQRGVKPTFVFESKFTRAVSVTLKSRNSTEANEYRVWASFIPSGILQEFVQGDPSLPQSGKPYQEKPADFEFHWPGF